MTIEKRKNGISLWNVTKKKSKQAREYVLELQLPFDKEQRIRFETIRKYALTKIEGNDILEAVGYITYFKRPRIYDWAIEKKNKKKVVANEE